MTTPPQGQNPFAQGQPAYGQQPPPQGGYGYPPQQGQPGPQGQPGMQQPPYFNQGGPATMPPPQRPRKSFKSILRVAGAIVGLIVIVGGWYASRDDADTASVGDCMHRGSQDDNDPDLEVVDCSSAKAQYTVLAKIKGNYGEQTANTKCKAEAQDYQYVYTETGDGEDFLLCLKDK
ncbi:LppU/SCO3897 family protein [Streptomyces odontomachi]|uniref:LppU/SCO3897 family protein n=1 Tax=Streptomyces odontomachi TaxID=2944940 RepID=UPI0021095668|nr:hypothetical protein [Streptomyces sp. ODS25]